MCAKHRVRLRDENPESKSSKFSIIVSLFDALSQVTDNIFVSNLKLRTTSAKTRARFAPECDYQ